MASSSAESMLERKESLTRTHEILIIKEEEVASSRQDNLDKVIETGNDEEERQAQQRAKQKSEIKRSKNQWQICRCCQDRYRACKTA